MRGRPAFPVARPVYIGLHVSAPPFAHTPLLGGAAVLRLVRRPHDWVVIWSCRHPHWSLTVISAQRPCSGGNAPFPALRGSPNRAHAAPDPQRELPFSRRRYAMLSADVRTWFAKRRPNIVREIAPAERA